MKHVCVSVIAVALLFVISTAYATIWYVHPDSTFNCIQDCLDSCATGDTVLVGSGLYYENIVWPSTQGIDLISEFGPDTTIIDGDSINSVIYMTDQVDTTTRISGFTIQNGYAGNGGGIWCSNSHPVITSNVIMGNSTYYDGAGIFLTDEAAPTIVWNIIKNNNSPAWGGGIYIFAGSSPYISRNVIIDNGQINANIRQKRDIFERLHDDNEQVFIEGKVCYSQRTNYTRVPCGGGILIGNYGGLPTSPIIVHNTINGNIASGFGGGIYCDSASPDIRNNIITSNIDYGVYVQGDSLEISYNDVWNNTFEYGGLVIDGPGNTHDDPVFVDSGMENFHLQWGSPCIDAGDPTMPMDPDSTVADMGVFYYDQTGIVERVVQHNDQHDFFRAAILSGPIQLPRDGNCKVFDITGRVVEPTEITRGIYFIEIDDVLIQKVIKVR